MSKKGRLWRLGPDARPAAMVRNGRRRPTDNLSAEHDTARNTQRWPSTSLVLRVPSKRVMAQSPIASRAAPTAAAVRAAAVHTLGDRTKADAWINNQSRTFGLQRREMLKSAQARRDVMTELGRIDHGTMS